MPYRLAALACLVSLLLPVNSRGYVQSTTTTTGTPLTWKYTNCVHIRVNSKGSDDIKDGSDVAAAKKSIQNWRDKIRPCSYLQFVELEATDTAKPGLDRSGGANENVIYWVESGWKHEKMAAAITTVFFVEKSGSEQDGRILDADIELNGEVFHFSTSSNPLRTDVENTVTHELGHLMGLDHPCDDGARDPVPKDNNGATLPKCGVVQSSNKLEYINMRNTTMFNFADPGETKKRSPEADDVQGICDTYPLNDAPDKCEPVTYGDDNGGCSVGSSAPPTLLLWFLLLGVWLVGKRRL